MSNLNQSFHEAADSNQQSSWAEQTGEAIKHAGDRVAEATHKDSGHHNRRLSQSKQWTQAEHSSLVDNELDGQDQHGEGLIERAKNYMHDHAPRVVLGGKPNDEAR